jgi:hypothetical protein
VKLGESLLFREICVPKSYYLKYIEFSGKIAADPPVSEIHEIDV